MVNKTSDMKEYQRLYYQNRKKVNHDKLKEYQRIRKKEYRDRIKGLSELTIIDPNIFNIKSFRNNP